MPSRLPCVAWVVIAAAAICGCDAATPGNARTSAAIEIGSSSPAKCALQLELPATIRVHTHPRANVQIMNVGSAPVTLVEPGDGSEAGWRTPIVGWSILPAASQDQHPKQPPARPVARCGNINPLKPEEVFVLAPGVTRELGEWVAFPPSVAPGDYRVVLYYQNVPDLEWCGLMLGKHDTRAMRRLRSSASVSLVSNEVRVGVVR